jgi:hypothetical protein
VLYVGVLRKNYTDENVKKIQLFVTAEVVKNRNGSFFNYQTKHDSKFNERTLKNRRNDTNA